MQADPYLFAIPQEIYVELAKRAVVPRDVGNISDTKQSRSPDMWATRGRLTCVLLFQKLNGTYPHKLHEAHAAFGAKCRMCTSLPPCLLYEPVDSLHGRSEENVWQVFNERY